MDNWGVYSLGLCGYVVKVNEDCESVSWYFDSGSGKQHKLHHAIVRYTPSGRAFFLARGVRVYLDECLRMSA